TISICIISFKLSRLTLIITLFPYTTLFRSVEIAERCSFQFTVGKPQFPGYAPADGSTPAAFLRRLVMDGLRRRYPQKHAQLKPRSEEHTSELQSCGHLVCRLLLEKKKREAK